MSRYRVSGYGYDYSLTPARPTGWRGALANITIFAIVMAVSAISGVVVTLDLFASSASPVVATTAAASAPLHHATLQAAAHATDQVTSQTTPRATVHPTPPVTQVLAVVATPKSATNSAPSAVTTSSTPAVADHPALSPSTVAVAPATRPTPARPLAVVQAPQPAAIADSDLTFAKGYAQRQAIAHGAPVKHGKVVMEAKTQLGRTGIKAKPKAYARNTNTVDQRRVATTPRPDAYGMFQHFERPDQFDFTHHQALAFGEPRTSRRNEAPRAPPPPSSNGFFGGLF
jgi:hypothetical protein